MMKKLYHFPFTKWALITFIKGHFRPHYVRLSAGYSMLTFYKWMLVTDVDKLLQDFENIPK